MTTRAPAVLKISHMDNSDEAITCDIEGGQGDFLRVQGGQSRCVPMGSWGVNVTCRAGGQVWDITRGPRGPENVSIEYF